MMNDPIHSSISGKDWILFFERSVSMEYTYQEFPESNSTCDGMKVVAGELNHIEPRIGENQPVYAVKNGLPLHLCFLYPMELETSKKYPLIVFVQGSAWRQQNLLNHVLDFYPVIQEGYVIAIVEYRPSSVASFPAQVIDTKDAVRYIIAHQDEYPIDINHLYLAGDSSGGHTVLSCLATWNDHRLDESQEELPQIRGCIDFYGPTHLAKMCEQPSNVEHRAPDSPEGMIIGGYDVVEYVEKAYMCSPIAYFYENQKIAPLLILHGSKDRTVPFDQSVLLFQRLKELSIHNVDFYQVKNGDHGGNVFWCPNTIKIVIEFLNRYREGEKV